MADADPEGRLRGATGAETLRGSRPSNRLVAATLEHRWNEALEQVDQVKQQYADFRQREALSLTPQQKQQALALAKDLPCLWRAPSTQAKDRKWILRLLIKDITVEKVAPKKILLHLRRQGGTCEDLAVELPPNVADRLRYPSPIVEKIRQLAASVGDAEIAAELTRQGLLSAKGKPFTASIIKWLRYKHRIPTPDLKHKEELTVKEVAHKFGVSSGVVYYWIAHGVLAARRMNRGSPCWITLDPRNNRNSANGLKDRVESKNNDSDFLDTKMDSRPESKGKL